VIEAKTAAEAAALWWAEQIGAPVFKMVSGHESRREREAGDFAGMMQSMLASSHPVSDEQGAEFATVLEKHVDKLLDGARWVSLGVDYGPDLTLANAAKAAGISSSRFPWKTHMSITRDYVTASLGYGARDRLVWSSPDWKRPPCDSHRYLGSGYDQVLDEANVVCLRPKYHDGECGDWTPDPARCQECGGTYVDHFGEPYSYKGHSWKPDVPS
jgi:hypothetical protein